MSNINQQSAEFETWWVAPGPEFIDERDIAWQAWQTATTKEREACAQLAQSLWRIDGQFTADEFAAEIRARGQEAS